MKFYLKFFGGILLGILLIVVIWQIATNKQYWYNWIEQSLSATSIEKTTATAPPTSAQPTPKPNFGALASKAATLSGVELVAFQDRGSEQIAQIKWQGANAAKGGDFAEALLNAGHLVDFDEAGPPKMEKNSRGDSIYTATFKLKMK